MKILIIRHCDPDYERDSLTQKGFVEAEYLTKRLLKSDITDIYCSPYGRAQETAKGVALGLNKPINTCQWLREFSGYIVNSRTNEKSISWDLYPSDWASCPEMHHNELWMETPIMQSGDVKEKYNEVCEGIDKLLAEYGYVREGNCYCVKRENRDTIALFCHFGVECVLLSRILNISPVLLWHGFVALPSSVTTLVTEERQKGIAYFRCNGFGDISHLYSENEQPSFAARFCECFSDDTRH